ncbi:hypothetical protein I79_012664 [Cricetulus griseus]|uniref:Uncharacterized protein n=1 Tax=Cricetulus griseus TaxID=10029 RepID=G3HPF2_CRIGR|nr:hypothetical protein I79_012664 [Cricetulus griseus]
MEGTRTVRAGVVEFTFYPSTRGGRGRRIKASLVYKRNSVSKNQNQTTKTE